MTVVNLLILGTYHFTNPGLDAVKTEIADIFCDEKQREITAVFTKLATFGPTKIAVEYPYNKDEALHQLYSAYRNGTHQLNRNEIQQLGFRLAAQLDHNQIYAIDHPGRSIPFAEAIAHAEKHHPAFVVKFRQTIAQSEEENYQLQQSATVCEILRHHNSPQAMAENHQLYLDFTAVGAGDSFIGAKVLSSWYHRNICIFANVKQISQPNDRILVIVGAGHLAILQELATSCSNINLVSALDYL